MMLALARFCGARILDRVLPDLEPERPCTYTSGTQPAPLKEWPPEIPEHYCVGDDECDLCGSVVAHRDAVVVHGQEGDS